MWVNFTEKELSAVVNGLKQLGTFDGESTENLMLKIAEMTTPDSGDDAYRNAIETDDELEVDPDAVVSRGGDPGCWVMAWLWVSDEQAGMEEPEDDEDEEG